MAGVGGGKSAVLLAKSVRFPGAVAVAALGGEHGVKYASVYIGDGAEFKVRPLSFPSCPRFFPRCCQRSSSPSAACALAAAVGEAVGLSLVERAGEFFSEMHRARFRRLISPPETGEKLA